MMGRRPWSHLKYNMMIIVKEPVIITAQGIVICCKTSSSLE